MLYRVLDRLSHVVFTGHWLGLYHTFRTSDGSEFGCEAFPNDYVDDTPARKFAPHTTKPYATSNPL